jgi:hypothetical protein
MVWGDARFRRGKMGEPGRLCGSLCGLARRYLELFTTPGSRLPVCHCFAEAVWSGTGCPGTACTKQWHTFMKNPGLFPSISYALTVNRVRTFYEPLPIASTAFILPLRKPSRSSTMYLKPSVLKCSTTSRRNSPSANFGNCSTATSIRATSPL